MMISEFIERTGFEPTVEEYRQIEEEYMASSEEKDQFCKNWKKNGGIQRLTRLRARKIEQLESNLRVAENERAAYREERNKLRNVFNDAKKMVNDLEKENESLKASLETLSEADKKWQRMVADLEARLEKYRPEIELITKALELIENKRNSSSL